MTSAQIEAAHHRFLMLVTQPARWVSGGTIVAGLVALHRPLVFAGAALAAAFVVIHVIWAAIFATAVKIEE
jgi:hypothetical protein